MSSESKHSRHHRPKFHCPLPACSVATHSKRIFDEHIAANPEHNIKT